MKKAYLIFVLVLVLTVGIAAAVALDNGVGSPDQECMRYGFDYGIAKYQCGDTVPDEGDGSTLTVSWTNCVSVDWTANPAVAGVLSKEANGYQVLAGGTFGTITKAGQNDISHITFCGNENGNEVPEFGLIGAALVIAGAAGFLIFRKK